MNELQTQESINSDEFLKGMIDCRDGVPHENGSESYNRGYAAQYQHEQNMSARNERH